jgi:hydroxycarboxylate dehydrogenase B
MRLPTVDLEGLQQIIAEVFRAHRVPRQDADLVSAELVRTELMGAASHGLIRVMQYVRDIRTGRVQPGGAVQVVGGGGAVAVVDCGWNLGIIAANRALDIAIDRAADTNLAAVVTQRCNHAGRLGSYAERAARLGFVCIAAAALPPLGHFVVPWGGMEGRLGTNPMAFGFPTQGDPVVADFATSVIPEGKIRAARMTGAQVPPDAVLDAEGRMTTDPQRFYGPPQGALLPFGGSVGYKGYALGLFVELLGGVLANTSVTDENGPINGIFLLVLDPTSLMPPGRCEELAAEVVDYMHSSRPAPGHSEVLVPGEVEFRSVAERSSLPTFELDQELWQALDEVASSSGIALSRALSDQQAFQ